MLRRTALAGLAGAAGTVVLGQSPAMAHPPGRRRRPAVIGHRGAWGYRPEHTLDGYRLAFALGADIVKPDVVITKDAVLISRNSPELSSTTTVAEHPEFAARRTTKMLDGTATTGWFAEDFTLAEIRTLRAKERMPDIRPGNARFDGRFAILTMQEVIDVVRHESRRCGRRLGIAPDVKRPTYYRTLGLPLEERFVGLLRRNGLTHRHADVAVFVQSFEPSCLQRLGRALNLPMVQLIDAVGRPYDFVVAGDPRMFTDLVTPDGLRWVHGYADVASVNKDLIIPRDPTAHLLAPTTLVRDAHHAGLQVHAWRFADENTFLPADFRIGTDPAAHGDFAAEYARFYPQGIDGVVSDFPDAAAAARRRRG
jgi:glycerophosphoryl diester phosphodiesterase